MFFREVIDILIRLRPAPFFAICCYFAKLNDWVHLLRNISYSMLKYKVSFKLI